MKKNALVIAGFALLSTNAFASKARLEALSGNNGAAEHYISDKGNVFRNAATINTHKNFVVTEWGAGIDTDAQATPRAEGGFFRDAGSMAYGLYLGNDGINNGRNAAFLKQDNALDLFLGGDAGIQWGARLHYANSKDEPGTPAAVVRKNTAFGLGLGVVAGAVDVYANVDLSDKSKGGTLTADEWKLKPTFEVGASYDWSGYTFLAEVTSGKIEQKLATVGTQTKDMSFRVGAGHVMEINPTARVIADVSFVYGSTKVSTTTPVATTKTKNMTLPVTLGFEADATSWLTLRGSVGQNVIVNNKKVETTTTAKTTNANTTTVNGGASLNFGKLAVDGLIGTTSSAGVAGSKTGVLSTDNLLTRVGVTYNF